MAMASVVHGLAGGGLCLPGLGAAARRCPITLVRWRSACWCCRCCWRCMPTAGGAKSQNSSMLLQGLQDHVGATPSEEQLDQLSQVIMRSQRSFKELIDSFDDAACAVSLDGTLRTVNKTRHRTGGTSPTPRWLDTNSSNFSTNQPAEHVEAGLARFLEKKHWTGTLRVRLKNSSRPLYFECVLNAILKGDEVVGVSVLGRDVTAPARKRASLHRTF